MLPNIMARLKNRTNPSPNVITLEAKKYKIP